ncbi:MAG: SDR family NAD(P)-dependent oxidoreductase [Rhodothermaceae bacterium]|nr:SDR family NAD(P)-dependent oxidoreductase [Rhodothermaceae bacterium]
MKKRTVIITGANSGIGKAASLKFAMEGHTVIMACRSLQHGSVIQDGIIAASNNKNIFLEELDASSSASIRAFCTRYRDRYGKLDILIHNAAYIDHGSPHRVNDDQIELTFATNVLGPYLLTMKLKDLLAGSNDARVLNAGSNIIKHYFNPKLELELDNLIGAYTGDKPFSVYNSYRNSKMALLMLTFRMADEFKMDGIRVYNLQINGAKMSKETLRKFTLPWWMIAGVQNLFFRPTSFMADSYYEICTSAAFSETSGKLINHRLEIMVPSKENPGIADQVRQLTGAGIYPNYADRTDMQEKLWVLCRELTAPKL